MQELLSLKETEKRFPFWTARTLRAFVAEKRLPAYKLGRCLYVDVLDMQTFIEAHRIPAKSVERRLRVMNG